MIDGVRTWFYSEKNPILENVFPKRKTRAYKHVQKWTGNVSEVHLKVQFNKVFESTVICVG